MSRETTFADLAKQAESPESERHESDVSLLRALLDESDIGDEHAEAFRDMLERLERSAGEIGVLSARQRAYAESVAEKHGISIPRRPEQLAANVPRGREVATPSVLSNDSLRAALDARKRRP